jgi:PRTRC genetic system ThiF family protein
MQSNVFKLPERFFLKQIRILLIGLGGNGSAYFSALTNIHNALLGLGHTGGLHVTSMDGDDVSQSNLLRQSFWPSDINKNKAVVLTQRHNIYGGLSWDAIDDYFEVGRDEISDYDIVISCVDSGRLRYDLCEWTAQGDLDTLLVDVGNDKDSGVFTIGHLCRDIDVPLRLPNVYDLYGSSLMEGDTSNEPTCSTFEALSQQSLFINKTVVTHSSALLWELLSKGEISYHGGFVDLKKGSVIPLPIDKKNWLIFGYEPDSD